MVVLIHSSIAAWADLGWGNADLGAALIGMNPASEDIVAWNEAGFSRCILVGAEVRGELPAINLAWAVVSMWVCALLVIRHVDVAHECGSFLTRFGFLIFVYELGGAGAIGEDAVVMVVVTEECGVLKERDQII